MAVKPIPEGYNTFTPYFVVEGATDFIEFLKKLSVPRRRSGSRRRAESSAMRKCAWGARC